MNLKAVMVAGVLALLFIPLTGGAGMEGSEAQMSVEGQRDLIRKTAEAYKADADERARAHYLSAEDHRQWHVLLGTIAIIATGVVTLVTTLSKAPPSQSSFVNVLLWATPVLALIATGVTALQTQRNDGGDAAKHLASMVGYENVKRGLEGFLLKLGLDDFKREEALQKLTTLMDQFNTVAQTSLILTPEARDEAAKQLQLIRDRPKVPPEADRTRTGAG